MVNTFLVFFVSVVFCLFVGGGSKGVCLFSICEMLTFMMSAV